MQPKSVHYEGASSHVTLTIVQGLPDSVHRRRATVYGQTGALASSAVWAVRAAQSGVESITASWMENDGCSSLEIRTAIRDHY